MVMRVVRHKPFLPGPVDGLRALDDDTEDHVYDTVGKHFDSRLSLEIHQEFTKVFILIHNATRFFHNSSLNSCVRQKSIKQQHARLFCS